MSPLPSSGYGNDVLVRMVLQAGADPNATNDFGHTALHLAVVGKKDQIKKLKVCLCVRLEWCSHITSIDYR